MGFGRERLSQKTLWDSVSCANFFLDSRERRGYWRIIPDDQLRSAFSFVEVKPGAVPDERVSSPFSSCGNADFYIDSTSIQLGYRCTLPAGFGIDLDESKLPIRHLTQSFDYLAEPVADLARASVHRIALYIFILGIVLQIVGFMLAQFDTRPTPAD